MATKKKAAKTKKAKAGPNFSARFTVTGVTPIEPGGTQVDFSAVPLVAGETPDHFTFHTSARRAGLAGMVVGQHFHWAATKATD
jgi:hypothetical protein